MFNVRGSYDSECKKSVQHLPVSTKLYIRLHNISRTFHHKDLPLYTQIQTNCRVVK